MEKDKTDLHADLISGNLAEGDIDSARPDFATDAFLEDLPTELKDLLCQYAHCTPPDDFPGETLSRFDIEHSSVVARKQTFLALGAALWVILTTATTALWLIIFNFTVVSKGAAVLSRIGLLTLRYLLEMWSRMPELGTLLMLSLWTVMFICAAMLVKAFRETTARHTTTG